MRKIVPALVPTRRAGHWMASGLDKAPGVFESRRPMSEIAETSLKPVVASYCTTFLKPEMRHIYRQVTGLRRYATFVLTRERRCEEQFPFSEIEVLPRARKNFAKRFWLKYVARRPPV